LSFISVPPEPSRLPAPLPKSVLAFSWQREKRSHLALFAFVVLLLPVNYALLETPVSIVNGLTAGIGKPDAPITLFGFELALPDFLGGSSLALWPGWDVPPALFLGVICATLLALMITQFQINYFIDIGRVQIEERLTRFIRETVFDVLVRLRPEAQARGAATDMTNFLRSNLRNVSGFSASAFVTPLRAGGMIGTALLLIFHQNPWLGLAGVIILTVDAWFFRTQLRDHVRMVSERQRAWDGYVTGLTATAERLGTVRAFGLTVWERGAIGERIARLFDATVAVHRDRAGTRLMQSLLLNTPALVFFLIGGWLVLEGQIDIGQLVAVVAAYQQIPDPLKELLDWDKTRAEAQVRYETVLRHAGERDVLPREAGALAVFDGRLCIEALTAIDATGGRVLDGASAVIEPGQTVLLTGPPGEGSAALVAVLTGSLPMASGRVRLGDAAHSSLADHVLADRLIVAEPEAHVLAASLRENIAYGLRRREGMPKDARLMAALDAVGLTPDLVGWALDQPFHPERHDSLADSLMLLRGHVDDAVMRLPAGGHLERFDPSRFLRWATLGENLVFGAAPLPHVGSWRVRFDDLPLVRRMADLGEHVAANAASLGMLGGASEVLAQRGLITGQDLAYLDDPAHGAVRKRERYLTIAWRYCEARHRLGLVDAAFEAEVLAARASLADKPQDARFDPQRPTPGLSVRDNLLFGRVAEDRAGARAKVADAVVAVLQADNLAANLAISALDMGIGPGAAQINLSRRQRAQLALARGLLADPAILLIEEALSHLLPAQRSAALKAVLAARAGRTTLVVAEDAPEGITFERVLRFTDGKIEEEPR
jgi:putative ABC transport system ATP-binding protein